jgi:hypothetical protein
LQSDKEARSALAAHGNIPEMLSQSVTVLLSSLRTSITILQTFVLVIRHLQIQLSAHLKGRKKSINLYSKSACSGIATLPSTAQHFIFKS